MLSLGLALVLASPPAWDAAPLWEIAWRRMLDRTSRPDPDGPLLQPSAERTYREYPMDLSVGAYPMSDEHAWQRAERGLRYRVQSLDEFELATEVEVKARAPLREDGRLGVGFRYDRWAHRTVESDLVRVDLDARDIGGSGAFARLGLFPRFEKDDADVELAVGVERPHIGTVELRLTAFDPFLNASVALAEGRGVDLARRETQDDPAIGVAATVTTAELAGVRLQLHLGALLPHTTVVEVRDDPEAGFERTQKATLAGAHLAWAPTRTLACGAAAVLVRATDRRESGRTREHDLSLRLYVLWRRGDALEVEAAQAVHQTDDGARDTSWLSVARATWWSRVGVGAEGGVMRQARRADGRLAYLDSSDHRLTTRVALRFGAVRAAVGVGWDLDPGDGVYDGGGMTLSGGF